jgi:hypothetical protein
MAAKKKQTPLWLDKPEPHNYPAALSYLSLLFEPRVARRYVRALADADIVHFKAKDIFRASGLSLLGISNSHVQTDRHKIMKGRPLSPLLLLRAGAVGKLIVADGYHRLCAVYTFDEDALVPCQIV